MAAFSRGGKRWLPRPGDDRGSLVIAMLLVLVGSMLASLMVPMLLTQINSSRSDMNRVHSLDAAEAGVDVAVGHIRAASDGSGNGVLAELPCGPITGAVGDGNGASYSVAITYYQHDPVAVPTGNPAITCGSAGPASLPGFAQLKSQGTAADSSSRSVSAVYTLQGTDVNIAGGLIHDYRSSATIPDTCMQAGSASLVGNGTSLTMATCVAGNPLQQFEYTPDLALELVSSTVPQGLCVDAGIYTAEAVSGQVLLQPCVTKLPQQVWSFNNSANFVGTSDDEHLDAYCLGDPTPNGIGGQIWLATGCNSGYKPEQTFQADASVGAGAAGTGTGQLVNYRQFGRCLDLPNFNIALGYLISWPCKQTPDPTQIDWNEKWAVPAQGASGKIVMNSGSSLYCLQSPDPGPNPGPYSYVSLVVCPAAGASVPQNLTWKVNGNNGDVMTEFEIVDISGDCLAPKDPNAVPSDLFAGGVDISKVVVVKCDGSLLEQWNANPYTLSGPLKDYGEH